MKKIFMVFMVLMLTVTLSGCGVFKEEVNYAVKDNYYTQEQVKALLKEQQNEIDDLIGEVEVLQANQIGQEEAVRIYVDYLNNPLYLRSY